MTTQADIKLVIDQLNTMGIKDPKYVICMTDAATMLETLGNQVAEQAAVIEKLRDALNNLDGAESIITTEQWLPIYEALAIQTDSTQILQEWLDAKLGEPVAIVTDSDSWESVIRPAITIGTELFKKPDMTGMMIDGS